MEDLIQNAHALFDERSSPSAPVSPLANDGGGRRVIHAGTQDEIGEKVEEGTT